MASRAWTLWLSWAVLLASLALWLALPRLAPWPDPWNAAETAVAGFVTAILALVAALGTFALREALVERDLAGGRLDPTTAEGFATVRTRLIELWLLCAAIGALGGLMSRHAEHAAAGWPYLVGAAALFVIHAPTPRFFRRVCGEGAGREQRSSRA